MHTNIKQLFFKDEKTDTVSMHCYVKKCHMRIKLNTIGFSVSIHAYQKYNEKRCSKYLVLTTCIIPSLYS